MSKQATLFKAWGGGRSSSRPGLKFVGGRTKSPVSSKVKLPASEPASINQASSSALKAVPGEGVEEYGFEEFEEVQVEEFFRDDITEELEQADTGSFPPSSSQPGSSVLNRSVTEQIPGFDLTAGELWVYPTNYSVRDYQFNIVQKALFRNTLVCLPTGLGKTFIAAVIMYNFYRWYPGGKIVFLAPTKPLVAQQIEACHNIMGICQEHLAEMTGQLAPKERNWLWRSRRVFFLTPQVMQNDLARGACPAPDVCCVVFDEAHKALGNHSYCQVIRELTSAGSKFRVLALSATPGNDLKAVQQVVTNLQVGQIELRSEDSFDVQQYVHQRKVEKMVVPLEGEILDIKTAFLKVLAGLVGRLSRYNLLYHSNAEKMSKFQILQARDRFRSAGSVTPHGVHAGAIEGDFALAITLYHAYELLELHGMRSFYHFLYQSFLGGESGQSRARTELTRDHNFRQILRSLGEKLGPGSDPDCSRVIRSPNVSKSFFYSHPKLRTLEAVVLSHFINFQESSSSGHTHPAPGPANSSAGLVSTRVMIFSQYRESVQEIADMLSQHAPMIRVMSFVGHGTNGKTSGKGLTQREQTEVVRKFRQGGYNTLVATCVGEEGLDIGEVDLIVCFDAHKSPVRLVQRMGRTGRKRTGRIVVIVAQGKEEQIYLKSQSNKNSIHRAIREGCRSLNFYQNSSKMVPAQLHPRVLKMHMSVGEFVGAPSKGGHRGRREGSAKGKAGQQRLRLGPKRGNQRAYLSDAELAFWSENYALPDRESRRVERAVDRCLFRDEPMQSIRKLTGQETSLGTQPSTSFLANTSLNASSGHSRFSLGLDRWVHWQTAPLPHRTIGHSHRSEQLVSLLEFLDLLHTSEDLGQSYELEMRSFLNPGDIKMIADGGSLECSEEQEEGGRRKRVRKRKRVLDSSDDEDFQSTDIGCRAAGDKCSRPQVTTGEARPETIVVSDDDTPPPDDNSMDVLTNTNMIDAAHPVLLPAHADAPKVCSEDDLAVSQHIVPQAPSTESLDWIELLEPSQVSTPKAPQQTSRSARLQSSSSVSASTDRSNDGFKFATPKAPPSTSKRSRAPTLATANLQKPQDPVAVTPATLSVHSSRSSQLSNYSGIDLFVLEEFGNVSWQEGNKPRAEETWDEGNRFFATEQGSHPPTGEAGCLGNVKSESEGLDPNVTVVEESDLEDAQIEEGAELKKADDMPPFLLGENAGSRPVMEGEGGKSGIPRVPSDDSFIEVHGRRKAPKRTHKLLEESPANQSSPLSPENKENSPILENRTEAATPSRSRDKETEGHGLGKHRRLQNRRRQNKAAVKFNVDSSDDEFQEPLLSRLRRKQLCSPASKVRKLDRQVSAPSRRERRLKSGEEEMPVGFLEKEAEQLEEYQVALSSDENDEELDYDLQDSFINDNTVLTQYSPSQACTRGPDRRNVHRSPVDMGDVYRRSLMSPDNLFAGKQKGWGNRYRMVLSQRHQLLRHYAHKAGLRVASGSKRPRQRRSSNARRKSSSSDVGLFESTASDDSSEAEEVMVRYGDEDLQELPNSQCSEGEMEEDFNTEDSEIGVALSCKEGPPLSLSDSGGDIDQSPRKTTHAETCYLPKRKLLSTLEDPLPGLPEAPQGSSGEEGVSRAPQDTTQSTSSQEVISASLLASIRPHRTPAQFSLGMDSWLSDSGEEEMDAEALLHGGAEGPALVEEPLAGGGERPRGGGEREAVRGRMEEEFAELLESLDTPLTLEEMEMNFGPAAGSVGDSEAHGVGHQRVSSSGELSTASLPQCSTGGGTILTSSRDIAHSQVVSLLRHRHQVEVMVCPLGHSGYIVSNRMMVERRMHSEFSTASAGGKVLARLRDARQQYDKVCLILEKDSTRKGMKKPVARPGHFLECALAQLVSADVVVIFSQSQEDTASLLTKLMAAEKRKGHAILTSEDFRDKTLPVLNLLLKVPRMNYVTALNLCAAFGTTHDLINCSPEEMKRRVPSGRSTQAQRICNFFSHKFDPNLVG